MTSAQSRPIRPRVTWVWVSTAAVALLAIWAIATLTIKWNRLTDVPRRFYDVVRLMVQQFTWSDLSKCLEAMWESIAIAWLGTLLAAVFAVPLALVAAENLVPAWMSFAVRQVLNILRAIPEIILVLVFLPVFGFSPTAGILAIGVGSIGTLAKLCSDVIEGIDRGPIEAADAVGASALQRLRWGVLPQAAPEVASFILYRFEINIRVSTILGAVGAGGIGQVANEAFRIAIPKDFGLAGMALAVMIVVTIIVDEISGRVRRRILTGPGRRATDRDADGDVDVAVADKAELLISGRAGAAPPS